MSAARVAGPVMSGGVEARIMGERESARLWCMRHGESTNALAPRGGLVRDAPLTEKGRRQAGVAAVSYTHLTLPTKRIV